jgi:hypothetical protein
VPTRAPYGPSLGPTPTGTSTIPVDTTTDAPADAQTYPTGEAMDPSTVVVSPQPVPSAATAPDLGAAASFAVLAGTAVTCTDSTVNGDVGTYPGTAVTRTNCMITGRIHPGDAAAAAASRDFLNAYDGLALLPCDTV